MLLYRVELSCCPGEMTKGGIVTDPRVLLLEWMENSGCKLENNIIGAVVPDWPL